MATFWESFCSSVTLAGVGWLLDLKAVIVLIAGLAIGERVIRFLVSISRG